MPTTIQVSETTRQLLISLRKKSKKSYDQIIREVLTIVMQTPTTLAGEFPRLNWDKKDRMAFDEA